MMSQDSKKDSEVWNLILIGRAGAGKSATANSIFGNKHFKSEPSLSGVTSTCQLRPIEWDGKIINVIDTPGFFELGVDTNLIAEEIAKCIDLVKDGIHALVIVLSAKYRFSKDEAAALEYIQLLFGRDISKYVIVLFTGGDELEENNQTLHDFITPCIGPLKELLDSSNNRAVLFNYKTCNETKRDGQLRRLMLLVEKVVAANGGQPFTGELLKKLKDVSKKHDDQQKMLDSPKASSEKLEEIIREMRKMKFREGMKFREEIRILKVELAKAKQEVELAKTKQEVEKLFKNSGSYCAIM